MTDINSKRKFFGLRWYAILMVFTTLVFAINFIHGASEFQFRTYRDGSEALVLGKVFADMENIDTGKVNLGFVEKNVVTQSSDVLALYKRVNLPNAVVPVDLNDQNWRHGISSFDTVFILPRSNIATLGYARNELQPNQEIRFSNGDIRTVTKVTYDEQFVQVSYSGEKVDGSVIGFPHPIGVVDDKNYVFNVYVSQYGIQGNFFSWIHKTFGSFATVERMQFLTAALCAIVLVLLCREYRISFSRYFEFAFFVSIIFSPWIVAVARNLYWVPALWFLPALVSMWIYRCPEKTLLRPFFYFLFFIAIFLKCLTGYEYLSTVILFSLAMFLIDPFLPTPKYRLGSLIKTLVILSVLSVAGFIVALLCQANMLADTIQHGLSAILQQEAIKYTSIAADGGYLKSANVPLLDVLKTYVFDWHLPVLFWINNHLVFATLIVLAFLSLVFQYLRSDVARHRDTALLIVMLAAPVSWFVLMRGHSVIHVHLNYVLWYFGFVPALLFVAARGVKLFWFYIAEKRLSAYLLRNPPKSPLH